ncbi:MAG: hypothetical protein LBT36_00710 [Oscillospiraceae bacterium]|jgi:hypothetical protein|nr:hypothetical protein [Oscillospiraceae bacterium]
MSNETENSKASRPSVTIGDLAVFNEIKRVVLAEGSLDSVNVTNEKDFWMLWAAHTEYLAAAELVREPWVTSERREHPQTPPEYCHDHCELCGAKFSVYADDLREGYVTREPFDGRLYYWICDACAEHFSPVFRWGV